MTTQEIEIKKRHIHDTAHFALENIPNIERSTIEQLLDLIDADGTHGTIQHDRLMLKIHQLLKYVPDACTQSLTILVDLLEIPSSEALGIAQASLDERG